MIFISLISFVALLVAFLSGSGPLFTLVAILVVALGIERGRGLRRASEKLQKVEKVLARGGYRELGGDVEEQIKGLLWQAHSIDGLRRDVGSRGSPFESELRVIRRVGEQGIRGISDRFLELTRSQYALVTVSEGENVLSQSMSGGEKQTLKVLTPLLKLLHQQVAPSYPEVFDAETHVPSRWSGMRYLLFCYERVHLRAGRQLEVSIFLGYPEDRLPLQREREILTESLSMIGRALREYRAVKHVSSKAQEEKKRQEKYFAHISHDIRTPLNNIQAILDLFFLEGVTKENKQFLGVARANCQSLRDIVEELLEFTKYKDGNLQIIKEKLNAKGVIEQVIEEFTLSAEVKELELATHIPCELGVEVDPKHLKRILMNLVSNSLKYTERGQVQVSAQVIDGRVQISVADTGVGIPQEKLHKLFVPFSRIGEVKVEGIGLGLTLTKILVESNGGAISVDSEHGKGSRFTIEFPEVELIEKTVPSQADEVESDMHVSLAEPVRRVLVIDDDRDAGVTLAKVLAKFSFEVHSISSLNDVAGLLNFWKPDIVISDVQIPDGGIQAVLKKVLPLGIPVVALTGCSEEEVLKQLTRNGVAKVLKKPVNPKVLADTLRDVMNTSPEEEEETSSQAQAI